MSLQKKCFTASAVMHGLLLLLVFIGSAFIPHKPKADKVIEIELFDFKDFQLVAEDGVFSGGSPNARKGDPNAPQQPTPKPPEPQKQEPKPPEPKKEPEPIKIPETKPEPFKQPEKVVEQPKPKIEIQEDYLKLITAPKPEPKKQPKIDLKANTEKRTIKTPADSKNNSKDNTRETQVAAATSAIEEMRNSLAGKLQNSPGLGSANGRGDVIDILGPGGPRRASYSLYLASKYRAAWVAPMKSAARTTVKVKVTISKDGTVLSSEVLSKSGNRDFDRAAEATVKRIVKFDQAPPTNEPSVTYTLEFIPDT